MKKGLLSFLLLISTGAQADLTFSPRYEYVAGADELVNRFILKSKLNANAGPLSVYVEGFGDFDSSPSATGARRSPQQGYLQEAYLEFKHNSFYIRLGRQAMRWSETWSVPSLDIWTGRRFNRLYFDPLSEQLTHSTGASFSYASQVFSLDMVVVNELAETTYPEPFPRTLSDNPDHLTSFGGRAKLNMGGFGFSAIGAQVVEKKTYGLTANYAFDRFVPKFEIATSHDDGVLVLNRRDEYFSTLGCDIFLGNVILLPQVTFYDFGALYQRNNDFQSAYYLSLQWNPNRHDLQAQVYFNSTTQDSFASLSYGYNISDYFTLTGFVQNYHGYDGSLYNTFQNITGGFVGGLRAEFSGNLPF